MIDVSKRMREAGWIQCLRLLLAGAMLLAAPGVSAAQTTRGSIAGTVRDGQGAAIPGVTVTATSARRNDTQTATTNGAGDFVILDLSPDTYTLKVTMDGFKTVDRENVVLAANDRLSVGVVTLDLGSVAETVLVTSRVIEVQSRSAERSFSVDSTAMENLAVNGRSPLALAKLAPGIANVNTAGTDLSFNVNGSRSGVHNLTVDGVSNMDTGNNGILGNINMDAVEEFKLLTNSYQAEYGRSSGAQISVVTKSGGRDYRGSAYWYKRHEGFNANSWLNNRERGLALASDPNSRVGLKAINRQNDIGYTLGGPIPITGFNKESSRLFFFFSQEHQRRFTPPANPNLVKVPTALERKGDFSQSVDNTGQPFPYVRDWSTGLPCGASDTRGCFQDGGVLGRIPQNRLYAPGLALLNAYPLPNTTGNGVNYSSQAAADRNRREDIVRIDWQASDAWRVFGRYFHNTNNAGNGLDPYGSFVLGSNIDVTTISDLRPVYNYSFSTTGVLTPSLFFEGTVGTGHNDLNIFDLGNKWNRTALGVTGLPVLFPNGIKDDYPPQIAMGGRYGTSPNVGSNNAPFYNFNTTYDFTASVTKIWGRHTAKAGFYAQRSLKDQSGFGNNNGRIEFNDDTANPFDTGYAAANAATGVFRFYDQASIWPVGQYRYWNVEWYVQDNWKVSSRLTLDYGLRFYWVQPQYDQALLTSNFIPNTFDQSQAVRLYVPSMNGSTRVALDPVTGQTLPEAFIGRIVPNSGSLTNGLHTGADPTVGKYLIQDPGILYAPRVGLTYDLTGKQDFILRVGGGAFYDRFEGNIAFDEIVNPPTTLAPRISYGLLQDLNPSAALLAPSALNGEAYAGQIPVTYNFNLGFQKKLPLNFIWDVAYVGSIQHHLPRKVNLNAIPYGATFAAQNQDPTRGPSSIPGQNALPRDFLRPYIGYGDISQHLFDANANYNGLQTQLDRRFTNGLFLNVNYTWSKALDTQDGNGDFSRIDQYDKAANYGLAGFDRRHIFNVNWVYELPRLQSAGAWLGGVVNNWQLSGGYRFESGVPYTLAVSVNGIGNRNITGSDTEGFRPLMTGDPGTGHSTNPYAQVSPVLTLPAVGTLGFDSGRNTVRRAPINTLDLSLQKSFPIHGSHRAIRFRLDAFNALNHTQFDTVNGTLNLRSLTDLTPLNLPYDASGNLIVANRNGFGAVTAVRSPRVLQLLVRFEF